MNNLDLEDIIYNDYFKDYNKQEIYKILNNLNKSNYKNQGEFNKKLRLLCKGEKKIPSKSILSTCYQELKKKDLIKQKNNLEKYLIHKKYVRIWCSCNNNCNETR